MQLPNIKALKKLADTCRKAGIKHFKSAEFEFTLTEEAPLSAYKLTKQSKATSNNVTTDNKAFESDTLSDNELLFWSTGLKADELNNGNND